METDITENLFKPDREDIERAFRTCPDQSGIEVVCEHQNRLDCLKNLEEAGFYGLLVGRSFVSDMVNIRAWKGKYGPCYDTGKTAIYKGNAIAVMDDDHHLLLGQLRVCEKTAALYSREPYKKWLSVDDGDPKMLKKLDTDPMPFDCDTFSDDAKKVYERINPTTINKNQANVSVMYPGPFKLLICDDGTVLWRGYPVMAPETAVRRGIDMEEVKEIRAALHELPPADNALNLFNEQGAAFLLGELPAGGQVEEVSHESSVSWEEVSEKTRSRLLEMIDREEPYFVLTGSDPSEIEGCCPSDDVGEANELVGSGVLSRWQNPAPPDDCPVSFYAFKGEILLDQGKPVYQLEKSFRVSLRKKIQELNNRKASAVVKKIKVVLLIFIGLSLLTGVFRMVELAQGQSVFNPELLAGHGKGEVLVLCFFRGKKRCEMCLNMEEFSRDLLQGEFLPDINSGRLVYREINYELPIHQSYVDHFELFTSSIVLYRAKNGKEVEWELIKEVWDKHKDAWTFKKILRNKLRHYLDKSNE